MEREALWEDTAFVFAKAGRELCVLDGGSASARRIWQDPEGQGSLLRDPAWNADGSTLYIWLNLDQQLCAIDGRTGHIRSLTDLDTHAFARNGLKLMSHLDPMPEPRSGGIVVDADRLILLLDEESNEQVPFWDRRTERGGCWLAAIDLRDGALRPLFEKQLMPHHAMSWDFSPSRCRLFAITYSPQADHERYRPRQIEERRLDGAIVRTYSDTDGEASELQLSPGQDMLLVERAYQPDAQLPSEDLKDLTRGELEVLNAAADGGFLVVDLESDAITDGPRSGSEARWAPDGDHVAYVDGWSVNICSLRDRTITPLIEGGAVGRDRGYGTWVEPVWSPDGRRLAITARILDLTLLLDLSRHEYVVIHEPVSEKIWARDPKPFGALVGSSLGRAAQSDRTASLAAPKGHRP